MTEIRKAEFSIGDTVYLASVRQEKAFITCPECCGSGRLRVILGDNSEVSIACVCCDRGYGGCPGKIETWEFLPRSEEFKITGVESKLYGGEQINRYSSDCWSIGEKDIFRTREEAEKRAKELVQEHEAEEKKRLRYKEKQHKTWAWNVSYWRREIRRAKKEIERYEAQLSVAPKSVEAED